MHLDPMMPILVGVIAAIIAIGATMRHLRQPPAVAYLIAGVILGPDALGLLTDKVLIARIGDVGVTMLLFFVGMEVSLPRLARGWRIAIGGTTLQIGVSVAMSAALGWWLGWPLPRIVLIGFVASLSSTAVVITILQQSGEFESPVGQDTLGVLLIQDLALVPMMIVLTLLGGGTLAGPRLALQLLGGVGFVVAVVYLLRRGHVSLPFGRILRGDHEMQVFGAAFLCFGLALLSGLLGLSAALGAFLAGIIVSTTKETEWVHKSLDPLRVLLVAMFFVSVGMLIDLRFLYGQWVVITLLLSAVLFSNTVVNAAILRVFGRPWADSFAVAAFLAPIGEFSFVLVAVGRETGLIGDYAYQLTMCVIASGLILCPLWLGFSRRVLQRKTASHPTAHSADQVTLDG